MKNSRKNQVSAMVQMCTPTARVYYAINALAFLQSRGYSIVDAIDLEINGSYELADQLLSYSLQSDQTRSSLLQARNMRDVKKFSLLAVARACRNDVMTCLQHVQVVIALMNEEIQRTTLVEHH